MLKTGYVFSRRKGKVIKNSIEDPKEPKRMPCQVWSIWNVARFYGIDTL